MITLKNKLAYCRLKTANFFCLLVTVYCLLAYTNIHPEIRYVSHTGTSTPPYTTWETAADSIQKAINICNAGDTVIVANGVYNENLVINTQIWLIGSGMDSTLIDGSGLANRTINFISGGSLELFKIIGTMEGVGRTVSSDGPLEIKNCKISGSYVGIGTIGSYLSAENLIMNNLTEGVATANDPNSDNYISNCIIILDNENSLGISLVGPTYANYYINNNIILFTGVIFPNSPESGISIGAPRRVYIYNNLISGFIDNIFVDNPSDTIFIKNNVLMYQDRGVASILADADYAVVNNVILSGNKVGIDGDIGFLKTDYNIFWENDIDLAGISYGDSDKVVDPMFVKDTIPNQQLDFDYHLQAFSPGIDKGDPNIIDKDGTRSDIGLYGGPFGEIYKYNDLAPKPPRNLSAVQDTNQILLKWNRNSEADTAYYNVYRDTVLNFIIDSTKLVASPSDTFFIHLPPYNSSQYVYTITCTDNQGNESNPSEEIVVKITSVNDYPLIISDYILYQNYPNPFNPTTKIGYKLKERGYIKLMVYDIKGELVSVLVNEEQEAGYYEVEFDAGYQKPDTGIRNLASGIYLYRIEVIGKGNIPVYSDMKKMILIK